LVEPPKKLGTRSASIAIDHIREHIQKEAVTNRRGTCVTNCDLKKARPIREACRLGLPDNGVFQVSGQDARRTCQS